MPISKSIANRILLLQAVHGDPLMRVSSDMPDDVAVLHDALEQLRAFRLQPAAVRQQQPLTLHLKNCGTALRFLQVHLQQCYAGEPVTLTGDERLKERDGRPTSQTASALIMHGVEVPAAPDESPYITMTRRMTATYPEVRMERDWSAAAFWYEYVAIHGGELFLEGLQPESLQGDRAVADIYNRFFGVTSAFEPEGVRISKSSVTPTDTAVTIDFDNIPDLYPAVALTCERLGMSLHASGTARLPYKETDRLEAVRLHEVRNDHRMAMALMAADYPVAEDEQPCIAKSYPGFAEQFRQVQAHYAMAHVTPRRGVNDEGKGKKYALGKLIHAACSEYIWMHDDDVVLPEAVHAPGDQVQRTKADLIILPLRMESESSRPNLLERLQMAEYAAIQELTMRSAKQGRAVMCSGANLIVRREVWLACEQDLHPEIPGGDDMFLLEAVKRRGYSVGVLDEPDYTAVVRPVTTWRAFFRQRMRWAGKAPHYTDADIIRCGALVLAANMLQLLCPLVLFVKFPIEYALIHSREKADDRQAVTGFGVVLLLEIFYPFYMLACLLGGLLRRREW